MRDQKKDASSEKPGLHPRNKHRALYDFQQLIKSTPELKKFVSINKFNNETIDFADAEAVKILNKSLLKFFYGIDHWDIPPNYLCPPVPGRADYIHYMADVIAACNDGVIPTGKNVKCLDIGMGANCIYPIIGNKVYGWQFVGADIDPAAIRAAQNIITANPGLKENIELRVQKDPEAMFKNIIQENETFDLSICNPPFHSSAADSQAGTLRKLSNLGSKKTGKPILNFGGQNTELWTKGGELEFVRKLIEQSAAIPDKCFWFSSLISKSSNLKAVYYALEKVQPYAVKTIDMAQGNKVSRIAAWTFLNPAQQKVWKEKHWH